MPDARAVTRAAQRHSTDAQTNIQLAILQRLIATQGPWSAAEWEKLDAEVRRVLKGKAGA